MRRSALAVVAVLLSLVFGGCTDDAPQPTATSGTRPAADARLLPDAQAYVDAVNAGDLDALVAAFAPDGMVIDVSREIRGREAIRDWAGAEVIGGSLRVDGVTPLGDDRQRVRVHWAPAGSAGWAADYTFTVADDGLSVADLQYA